MSKQSEAKSSQGYNPKPVSAVCANCMFFKSDFINGESPWNSHIQYEKNKRCGKGGFAVLKTASCNEFARKQEGAEV